MAKAPKPTGTKGLPVQEASTNTNKSHEFVGLNFKVDSGFRREFKTYAAEKDISMNALLKEMFDLHRSQR